MYRSQPFTLSVPWLNTGCHAVDVVCTASSVASPRPWYLGSSVDINIIELHRKHAANYKRTLFSTPPFPSAPLVRKLIVPGRVATKFLTGGRIYFYYLFVFPSDWLSMRKGKRKWTFVSKARAGPLIESQYQTIQPATDGFVMIRWKQDMAGRTPSRKNT